MNKGFIYIIDDKHNVRFTFERIFKFVNYPVKSFVSVSAALGHDLSDRDSCIVLDLNIPEMGGLECQYLLNDRHIIMPIIL